MSSVPDKKQFENAHFYHFSHEKAGMAGVDLSAVSEVVRDQSAGSKYYEHEEERDRRLQTRISGMQAQWNRLSVASPEMRGAAVAVAKERAAFEAARDLTRAWVVVDMDMFYAAVEMRDRPELRDKPMAVGGMGMLSTSNYAARKFGVRSAMPGFIAKQLCPQLVIIKPDYSKYKEAAKLARRVFKLFDVQCQALSLDEACLDITDALAARGVVAPARISSVAAVPAPATAVPGRAPGVERGTGMMTVAGDGPVGNTLHAMTGLLAPGRHCLAVAAADATAAAEAAYPATAAERREAGDDDTDTRPGGGEEEEGDEHHEGALWARAGADAKAALVLSSQSPASSFGADGAAEVHSGPKAFAVLCRPRIPHESALTAFHTAAWDLVNEIRCGVTEATRGLTCSAGIAPNPMLAKVASDLNKPNGQCLVPFDAPAVRSFVGALYVRKLPGIGRISEAQLTGLGLNVVADVRREMPRLRCLFTPRMAEWLHRASLGISETRRGGGAGLYRRKSISIERTFSDLSGAAELCSIATSLCSKLASQMQGQASAFAVSLDPATDIPPSSPRVATEAAGSLGPSLPASPSLPPAATASTSSTTSASLTPAAGQAASNAESRSRAPADGGRRGGPAFSHTPGFFGTAESDSEDEATGERKRHPVMRGRTLTLKLKLATFEVRQRSLTLDSATNNGNTIAAHARRMLKLELDEYETSTGKRFTLRLIGIKMHNLVFDADEEVRQARGIDALLKRQRGAATEPTGTPSPALAEEAKEPAMGPPLRKRRPASEPEASALPRPASAEPAPAPRITAAPMQPATLASSRPSVLQQVLQRRMLWLRAASKEPPQARRATSKPASSTMDAFVKRQ